MNKKARSSLGVASNNKSRKLDFCSKIFHMNEKRWFLLGVFLGMIFLASCFFTYSEFKEGNKSYSEENTYWVGFSENATIYQYLENGTYLGSYIRPSEWHYDSMQLGNIQPQPLVSNFRICDLEIIGVEETPYKLAIVKNTGSMRPTISDNSTLILVPAEKVNVSIGDIIVFEMGDLRYVHRIIKEGIDESGRYYVTSGDNVRINDGKIRPEDIRSVVVGVIY